MKNIILAISLFVSLWCYSQQDAQYTQYMYNTMSINPAYAGTRDVFSFNGLYRTQWVGLDGAPKTVTLGAHSPVSEKIGLGMNIVRDEIFITQETSFDVNFSYAINLSYQAKLAFGLKAGGHILDVDYRRLIEGAFDPSDTNTQIDIDQKFSPQIGAGLYYYTNDYYLGLSAPNLLETRHFDTSEIEISNSLAKERINYYLMMGYVMEVNKDIKFKPAGLVKLVEGAPLQVDLSANFLFSEKLMLGAAYRWSAALSALAGYQLNDQLMIGIAYDIETTELAQYNSGSYEFMLRYELFNRKKSILSPRFF